VHSRINGGNKGGEEIGKKEGQDKHRKEVIMLGMGSHCRREAKGGGHHFGDWKSL